ncbi:MAG: hypothetical protein AMXMBFR13_36280 [Phycisphaerae bacterium]|jgi:CBS domain-containing protein
MRCPLCGWDNIDGADTCEDCSASLTCCPPNGNQKTVLEESIECDPLAALQPVRPVTVAPTDTVGEVIALLSRRNIGCALVVWCDTLVGIFTERDALMKIGSSLEEVGQQPIRHYMTPAPEALSQQDTIAFALNRMAVGDFRHIPIEHDEKPVGIVSVRDVLSYITRQFPELLGQAS